MLTASPVTLSPLLEGKIFDSVLNGRGLEALRTRCENYQAELGSHWKPSLLPGYAQYFGFQTALKVKAVLKEISEHGYGSFWTEKPLRIVDIGAGTLGATLGALDFLKENDSVKIDELWAMDRDAVPVRWALEKYSSLLPRRLQITETLPHFDDLSHSLFLFVDVLNEIEDPGFFKWFSDLLARATPTTLIVVIEPASKWVNQRLLRHRDEWLKQSQRNAQLLLPCTHQLSCPALADREWCHEERDFRAPTRFWQIVQKMGFRRNSLVFSLLVWGGQSPRFSEFDARVVSRHLKSKGRGEKWLCALGKRWKAARLTRDKSPEAMTFFEAERGQVLDCRSTPPPPND